MSLTIVKSTQRHPLCVDLDGTLVNTDTLWEAILVLLKSNLLYCFLLPVWLLKGRAGFKYLIFQHAKLRPDSLPYNQTVLDAISAEREQGRPIVLVTASSYIIAEAIAEYLNCFTEVLSSDETRNLKGKHKSRILVEKYGEKGYDYIGNSMVDIPVWKTAHAAILVNCSPQLVKKAKKHGNVTKILQEPKPIWALISRQIRIHQWLKNLLIFCPLILSHRLTDWLAWTNGVHAFISFSLLSSSVYVLNDILDLQADRQHPTNAKRPFASGDLSLSWAVILFPILFVSGLTLAALLSGEFLAIVLSYFALTSAYSLRLKQVPIADIIILASLYSWRVFAGSVASGITFSEWFFTFAVFFFLSLALVKRCAELIALREQKLAKNMRRGYLVTDLPLLVPFGVVSGYLSILVLALYFNTSEIKQLNQYPKLLWAIFPFLLFWISRVWLIAFRNKMPSDPLLFTVKDQLSYFIFAIIAGLWLVAKSW